MKIKTRKTDLFLWYIQNDCKYLVVFWNRMSLEKALFLFQNVWRHGLWLAEPARRKTSVIFGAICRKQSNYTKTYVIREYGISSLDSNVLLILEITFPREVGLGVGYYHTLCLFFAGFGMYIVVWEMCR